MGHSKEKKENEWISRCLKHGAGQANLRKKEKTNGLVRAKNRGRGTKPKEKRENEWISRGSKQGAGQANIRKKKKTNGLERAKNRGRGRPP